MEPSREGVIIWWIEECWEEDGYLGPKISPWYFHSSKLSSTETQ